MIRIPSTLRALTLKPEHAELVINGQKRIENRTWGRDVRGPIAIHRGGRGGAIVGLVEVLKVVSPEQALREFPEQSEYIHGPYCWVLGKVQAISPVTCRGQLSLWRVSDELLSQLKET